MDFESYVKRYSLQNELGVTNRNFGRSVWDHQQKEIDQLKKEHNQSIKDGAYWMRKCEKLEADLEKAKDCLEFYGNIGGSTYGADIMSEGYTRLEGDSYIDNDGDTVGGKRARQFLKDLTFEGEE